MSKILAIGAHPDDVEFGCGALLIREIAKGNSVKIVVCSLGEAGTNGTPAGRKAEATASAKFIGAEIEFINLGGDCKIEHNSKNSFKIAEIIRKYKPNIVLTTSLSENQHPDHIALRNIVRSSCRIARYGGLKELKKYGVHAIDALYYFSSSSELEVKPDIIIDISSEAEKWEKAMSFHKSQMKTHSYIEMILSRARFLGASMGVKYALCLWANDPIRTESVSGLSFSGTSRKY